MASKNQENLDLVKQLETREAGVADLLEFYTRVEKVYSAASRASEEPLTVTSNSTNAPVR